MKTKDLIAALQEADPSGEIECCVGNEDIHFVSKDVAYWDGDLQVLTRDHSKDPYYNIVGARMTHQGFKIQIRSLSIYDCLWDLETVDSVDRFPIETTCGRQTQLVAKWRADAKDIIQEVDESINRR